jgi:glycosyltransferase involved in cell wall biosynthesis
MGGMERASSNLANTLYRKGFDITYFSIFKTEKFFSLDNGIHFVEPVGFNEKSLSILKTILYIRKFAKQENIKTFIIFNKLYSAIALMGLTGFNKRTFISERSSPIYKWPYFQEKFIRTVFYFFKPTGIISQTQIAADFHSEYYGKSIPVLVLPNVLPNINVNSFVQKEKIILAVGRLDDYLKGFDRLINAFLLVTDLNWKLVIVGKRDDGGKLYELIEEHQLSERIELINATPEIHQWYSKASIFVIPSRSEGFPNALAEAMAYGLPCVAFDFVAGPRDLIINNYNGFLVKDGDIAAFAGKINELINDKELRIKIGKNAEEVRYNLSEENITKKLVNFLNNV